ncbi:MAG: hypothetical protein UW82_C0004G0061 [candidate division WWE3 bacterium GW2011_GWC2_44_9]|uniref:Uncharacterized protein n=1 Tax=candidate division WWE3 bacterium GW2011_GWC2_44_9 TaxID=1619125 RepID=A0A0G1KNK0_UNCKA|nr:MAG: hypothetical protein UW82_C0004G0061 [candidate division WWE3 bacterium GW2011_GWC2_44_9]OGW69242.1 MAG: hypothetical protein A2036_03860 [Omnitrophica bacterium GWA2_50_21]
MDRFDRKLEKVKRREIEKLKKCQKSRMSIIRTRHLMMSFTTGAVEINELDIGKKRLRYEARSLFWLKLKKSLHWHLPDKKISETLGP